MCDRQCGLGADGILRVARAGALADAGVLGALPDGVAAEDWFMDYRNSDGSIAEMCGNGVRVFAHYLKASGLESKDEFVVGSRAGARPVVVHGYDATHGDVTVAMGPIKDLGTSSATIDGRVFAGVGIDVGNPHLACVDEHVTPEVLSSLDLSVSPGFRSRVLPARRQYRDRDSDPRRWGPHARTRARCGRDSFLRNRNGRSCGRGAEVRRPR